MLFLSTYNIIENTSPEIKLYSRSIHYFLEIAGFNTNGVYLNELKLYNLN